MIRSVRRWVDGLIVASLILAFSGIAWAGEKPEHYYLIYAMARAAGFDNHEAHVIASASWAMDQNNHTVAVTGEVVRSYISHLQRNVIRGLDDPRGFATRQLFDKDGDLKYAAQGAANHALASPSARASMERFWKTAISSETDETKRLILTGMYLHFLVDRHVHPNESFQGHLWHGHAPDRAFNQPERFVEASKEALSFLQSEYGRKKGPREASRQRERMALTSEPLTHDFARRTVRAISGAYEEITAGKVISDWTTLDGRQNDEKIRQRVERAISSDFSNCAQPLTLQPYEQISYARDPGDHTQLRISAHWVKQGGIRTFVTDPVHAVASRKDLAPVREELVRNAQFYVSNVALLALGTSVLASKPHLENLGIAAGRIPVKEAQELLDRAADAYLHWADERSIVYGWAKEKGIHGYTRLENKAYRVVKVLEDGLHVYDLDAQGGKKYVLSSGIVNTVAPRVGGVLLDVSEAVLSALTSSDARHGNSVILLRDRLALVSLKNYLAAFRAQGKDWTSATLPVSRIYGFFVDPGTQDLVLVGTNESPMPLLRLEDLVTAIRAVWKNGETPGCSLDPESDAVAGPQYSKVLGVPFDSHFAMVMLEADYKMKALALGAHPDTDVISIASLGRAGTDVSRLSVRLWLKAMQPKAGQILVSPSGNAAIFSSRIEVNTETMHLTSKGMIGTGSTDDRAEEVARSMTEAYPALERRYPVFHQLHTLMDAVSLCSILRQAGTSLSLLNELEALVPPPSWTVPRAYPGLKIDVSGVTIGGGAELSHRLSRRRRSLQDTLQFARLRERAEFLSRSGKSSAEWSDGSIAITRDVFRFDSLEQDYQMGRSALASRNLEQAERIFSGILTADPDFVEALSSRAVARFWRKDYERAADDLLRAREKDPEALYDYLGRLLGIDKDRRPVIDREVANTLVLRASHEIGRGDWTAAADSIERATGLVPELGELDYFRARIADGQGKRRDAMACVEAAIGKGFDGPAARFLHSRLLCQLERVSEAYDSIQKVAEARGLIDTVYDLNTPQHKEIRDRADRMEKMICTLLTDPEKQQKRAEYSYLAFRLAADGEHQKAIHWYGEANRLLSSPGVLVSRGESYFRTGQLKPAFKDFEAALFVCPDFWVSVYETMLLRTCEEQLRLRGQNVSSLPTPASGPSHPIPLLVALGGLASLCMVGAIVWRSRFRVRVDAQTLAKVGLDLSNAGAFRTFDVVVSGGNPELLSKAIREHLPGKTKSRELVEKIVSGPTVVGTSIRLKSALRLAKSFQASGSAVRLVGSG